MYALLLIPMYDFASSYVTARSSARDFGPIPYTIPYLKIVRERKRDYEDEEETLFFLLTQSA